MTSATLCGFCDASTKAYAAVIYIVLKTETESVRQFVSAKTRLAPLQGQTIPRLELLSAFLLSKLICSVHHSLQNQFQHLNVRCYTDSQVALYWIHGKEKEWKTFVQNRVRKIRNKVPPKCWFHCLGLTNPADIPSRGLTMAELSVNLLWRTGPEWLETEAPLDPDTESLPMPEPCSLELKATCKKSHTLLAVEKQCTLRDVVQCYKFSSLQRLLRVPAYEVQGQDNQASGTNTSRCYQC